jgi:glycosyltransferase involved in cell wall biosynthesis
MKLVVTIPAYNEEATITRVLKEIPRHIEGIDVIETVVVDDGSNDNTIREALLGSVDEIITHRRNMGLGITFRDGMNCALEKDADIIVNIDADGQHNPAQIPTLIKPILDGAADIVLGYRDLSDLEAMPRGKKLGNKLGNKLATWVTRRLSGQPIIDAQTGFRAFSREAALKLNLFGRYTYVQETIIQAAHKDLLIVQVPIEFKARDGDSRLITNTLDYALKAGRIIFSTYRDYYPLRFFSFIGGIFSTIGLALGIKVLVHFAQTGMVSPYIPSTILSSLLIIVGMGTIALGVFVHMLNNQRRLSEEILYRLKKNGSKHGSVHHAEVPPFERRDGKSGV